MDSTKGSRPSWQTDDCPTWCVSDHREDDFPGDRFHDSAPAEVAVIMPGSDSGRHPETAELHVITSRRCGDNEDWTFIGRPDHVRHGVTLSRESAHRLSAALSTHLSTL